MKKINLFLVFFLFSLALHAQILNLRPTERYVVEKTKIQQELVILNTTGSELIIKGIQLSFESEYASVLWFNPYRYWIYAESNNWEDVYKLAMVPQSSISLEPDESYAIGIMEMYIGTVEHSVAEFPHPGENIFPTIQCELNDDTPIPPSDHKFAIFGDVIYGDANEDGEFSFSDAIFCMENYYCSGQEYSTYQHLAWDVSGNYKRDFHDIYLMLRRIVDESFVFPIRDVYFLQTEPKPVSGGGGSGLILDGNQLAIDANNPVYDGELEIKVPDGVKISVLNAEYYKLKEYPGVYKLAFINTNGTHGPLLQIEGGNPEEVEVFGSLNGERKSIIPIVSSITSVEEQTEVPTEFLLLQNYPNPFNPTTTIQYSISESDFVSLKIYDILGNEVQTLVNERKSQGNFSVEFNASNLPSGIYLYTIQVGKNSETRKMTLMK